MVHSVNAERVIQTLFEGGVSQAVKSVTEAVQVFSSNEDDRVEQQAEKVVQSLDAVGLVAAYAACLLELSEEDSRMLQDQMKHMFAGIASVLQKYPKALIDTDELNKSAEALHSDIQQVCGDIIDGTMARLAKTA